MTTLNQSSHGITTYSTQEKKMTATSNTCKSRFIRTALPFAALTLVATSASATIIPVRVNSTTQSAYAGDVSSSDLLDGLTGVDSGVPWKLPSSRVNNGSHGPDTDTGHISWADPGSAVTFDLGLGINGLGWDITSIQTIAAWNSAGFGNQGYTIEVQLKDAVGFTTLTTELYNPLGGGGGATKITLTDDTGVLASGVEFIRFTHNSVPGTSGGEVTYREFDVFGSSTLPPPVPEPSSLLLLGLGALGLVRQTRRKARK